MGEEGIPYDEVDWIELNSYYAERMSEQYDLSKYSDLGLSTEQQAAVQYAMKLGVNADLLAFPELFPPRIKSLADEMFSSRHPELAVPSRVVGLRLEFLKLLKIIDPISRVWYQEQIRLGNSIWQQLCLSYGKQRVREAYDWELEKIRVQL